jgi:hypothetical protein
MTMKKLNLEEVNEYVNEQIAIFHEARSRSVSNTTLKKLVSKNPYLLKAKNINSASELVKGSFSARLSSSEEERFGQFLEGLAIFIAEKTTGGHKSGVPGVDLEFNYGGWHYFVGIKSGTNWGNGSQQNQLERELRQAVQTFKQGKGQRSNVDSVLGICYGKTRTSRVRGYLKLVGQNFWTFVSGNKDLYTQIIEPIGYRAKEHNDAYEKEIARISNKITLEFIQEYCYEDGSIDWDKLVQVTCGNFDLDRHGFDY